MKHGEFELPEDNTHPLTVAFLPAGYPITLALYFSYPVLRHSFTTSVSDTRRFYACSKQCSRTIAIKFKL